MSRRVLVVVSILVLALAVSAASTNVPQINVLWGWPDQIDGQRPCYVQHGLFIKSQELKDSDYRNSQDYLQVTMTFTLWVDGEVVDPVTIKTQHLTAARSPYGIEGWSTGFFYMFPARYFTAGSHTFEGLWIYTDGSFTIHRAMVVEVVYNKPGRSGQN